MPVFCDTSRYLKTKIKKGDIARKDLSFYFYTDVKMWRHRITWRSRYFVVKSFLVFGNGLICIWETLLWLTLFFAKNAPSPHFFLTLSKISFHVDCKCDHFPFERQELLGASRAYCILEYRRPWCKLVLGVKPSYIFWLSCIWLVLKYFRAKSTKILNTHKMTS